MNAFYAFAGNHPIITVLLAWSIAGVLKAPFQYAFMAYNRRCRSRNIAAQGWPTASFMDADGDIVHPKDR